jgi:hypothetical protein
MSFQQICHLDRSVAKWRDLRFLTQPPKLEATGPGRFDPTDHRASIGSNCLTEAGDVGASPGHRSA